MKEQIEEMAKVLRHGTICYNCRSSINGNERRDWGCHRPNNLDCPHDEAVLKACEALYNAGYRKQEWISVDDRLPEDGQMVLIYDGGAYQWKPTINNAIFQKGKTAAQLKEEGYRIISGADEHGNNKKPYKWRAVLGPMDWFGQMVTHWMPLPQPPKMKGGAE